MINFLINPPFGRIAALHNCYPLVRHSKCDYIKCLDGINLRSNCLNINYSGALHGFFMNSWRAFE